MLKKKNYSLNYFISILSIIILGGCTVEQTYKTLTFFFDGVPPLNSNNATASNGTQIITASNKDEIKRVDEQPKMFLHKPYFDRNCEQCHTPARGLLQPLPGLCYRCHTDFNKTFKYLHAPIQSGNCTKCHNQHLSEYPKLLIRAGKDLCLYCHNSTVTMESKFHREIGDANCLVCHNPHGGNTRNFLRDNAVSNFNGLGLLNEFASKRIYGRFYIVNPGDIPNGKEVVIQDNDKNFEISNVEKINNNGQFYIDNIKRRGNYTVRLKGEEYDSVRLELVNYKNEVIYDFGYNKKAKFIYSASIYDSVHNGFKRMQQENEQLFAVKSFISNDNKNADTSKLAINQPLNATKNAIPQIDENITVSSEFAIEFRDSIGSDERMIAATQLNKVYVALKTYKSAKAYIYISITGSKVGNMQARNKGKDIIDYLNERNISKSRLKLVDVTRVEGNYYTGIDLRGLTVTILVK